MRTAENNDALAWIDRQGRSVTESQLAILKMAECAPNTPGMPRNDQHHDLVMHGVEQIAIEERTVGGGLGRPTSARARLYERLKRYAEQARGTLFDVQDLHRAIEEIYRHPLRTTAADSINRQLRGGISDKNLVQLVLALRDDDRLCLIQAETASREPQIICSMGLFGEVKN